MVNITDVANRAGVSHQTVSRVLNTEDAVRPATRARVERAIQELNYRPSAVARALVSRKTRTLGLISTGMPLYGPSSTMLGFNEAAREADYQVTIASMATSGRGAMLAAVEVLLRQNVEALVLIASDRDALDAIAGVELGVPLVTVESSGRTRFCSVSIDQFEGARLATAHLADLGHREILHLSGPPESLDAAERERGWRAELHNRGLAARDMLIGNWLSESGYQCGQRLAESQDFTAIFSANDQMALGLLHAFSDAGIRVPEDVSIVGFDDMPEAAHFTPPLTTIRQDFGELGREIMATLLTVLAGNEVTEAVQAKPELIVRRSAGGLQAPASSSDQG